MTETEKTYYQRREMEERDAAAAATDIAVRDAHLMMAERYADRASMLEEQHFADSADEAVKLRYANST